MRDIQTLLRESDPAATVPSYTDDERARLLETAVDAPAPKGRIGWRVAAVAAAAALVTALGVSNLQGTAVSARADEVLTEAAINAVDPPARADQWWQITTDSVYASVGDSVEGGAEEHCLLTGRRVQWVAVDGSRASIFQDESLASEPLRPGDECEFSGGSSVWSHNRTPAEMPDNWQGPSPQFLASLPRDVDQLRDRLYADTKGKGNGEHSAVFTYVADVLRSGIVPADLRASLFGVLKTLPGIDVTGEEEVDGRTVVGLAIADSWGSTAQLLIDPAGGVVVGERSVYPTIDATASTNVTREVVDEVPADVLAAAEVEQAAKQCEMVDGIEVCQG